MQVCEVSWESALHPKQGTICVAAHNCVNGTMSPSHTFPAHVTHFNRN